jgi:hypothetical protein
MTLTKVGQRWHLDVPDMLLVFTLDEIEAACHRGKAYQRTLARQAREAQMAVAVEAKREERCR